MKSEINAKIERLASIYENRILVIIAITAVVICACLTFYTLKVASSDRFDLEKGDRAVITYDTTYYGRTVTLVATWVDKEGITHYTTERPRLAGFDSLILILIMINVGLAKASYDIFGFLTGRYRRRLISRFQYRLNTK